MFFRKREKPPTPAWLKWLLLFFLLYAVVAHQRPDTKDNPNPFRQAVDHAAQELNPSRLVNFNEYKEQIFPTYVAALRIKDTELGTGLPVVCGQEVSIAYNTFQQDNTPFDDSASKENPLTFVIGEHTVMPVFEQGVIGMQPGGARSLLAPPNLAYGAEGFKREGIPPDTLMRFEVTLLDVSPALPDSDRSPYRIANVATGGGKPFLCGESLTVHVTIWSVDGKKLYSSRDDKGQPIVFTLGKSEVFVGLEQGVVGITPGTARTLIVPPDFQKPLRREEPLISIPLPENETVIVDVESIP